MFRSPHPIVPTVYPSLKVEDDLANIGDTWISITSGLWFLEIISLDYVPFNFLHALCSIHLPPSLFRDISHENLLRVEVQSLLQLGGNRKSFCGISGKMFLDISSFLTHLQNRGLWPVLNLRKFSSFIRKFNFCMITTLPSVVPYLSFHGWFGALELRDTYFHIGIRCSCRKYLQLMIGQDHCQYKVLPLGFSMAPWIRKMPLCRSSSSKEAGHPCLSILTQSPEKSIVNGNSLRGHGSNM